MVYSVRVQAILAPMSNGNDAPTVTPEDIREALRLATDIYRAADVEFLFDPASDVITMPSDLLSRDYTLAPGEDLNGPRSVPPVSDDKPNTTERNRVAGLYPGKLVVFFAFGRGPVWDDATHHWVDAEGAGHGNWSNQFDAFVRMLPGPPGEGLSHEIGHYLHLVHTFASFPDDVYDVTHLDDTGTKKGVRSLILDFTRSGALPRARALEIFDGDLRACGNDPTQHCITDTPPDPGPGLFQNSGLDPCAAGQGTLRFDVRWPDGQVLAFAFSPDRENIMNYWNKTCRGLPPRLTRDQIAGVQDALVNQNRAHLTATKILYSAVWEAGNRGTTRAIGWAFSDFVPRFDAEIAAGRHLVHMQAYDLGGGQIRWDAVWEAGDHGTSFVLTWSLQDFWAHFRQEIGAGRHLVHLQTYDLGGGQRRWDAVWETGDKGNSGVLGWGFNNFVTQLELESGSGRRLVHQQAYDIGGGQIRYDGIWENNDGGQPQTRILSESMKRFADRFDKETGAGRHIIHMQAVSGR